MDTVLIALIHPIFSLFLGISLSAGFVGETFTRKNIIRLTVLSIGMLALLALAAYIWDVQAAVKNYPFFVHIPLLLFYRYVCKRPLLVSAASILSAYLLCQIPQWISTLISSAFSRNAYIWSFSYIVCVLTLFLFALHYGMKPARELMQMSRQNLLIFAALPAIYYCFDYITTVYTDLLYEGNWIVVQFMPMVAGVFFFLFVAIYHRETHKSIALQQERDLVNAQLRQTENELSSMYQMQQAAAEYRHNLRHHFGLLYGYANAGNMDAIRAYLQEVSAGMDAITPQHFCNNETVNVICAYYTKQAEILNIDFMLSVQLPERLSISNSELCALLSNGLENAFHAAKDLAGEKRWVTTKMWLHRNNILISIENPCDKPIVWEDGLPQSNQPGHGYGTRSIAAILNQRGGQYLFSAKDNLFKLQIVLPQNHTNAAPENKDKTDFS